MNRNILLCAFIGLGLSQVAIGADAPPAADSPAAVADKMLDPTRNASAFKDPEAFKQWTAAMLDPATSMALAQKGIDPNTAVKMLAGMMNPATLQNYMQFTNPAVSQKWMTAGMNPNFYTALMQPGLNPASYTNWMTMPVSPQAMGMGTQMLNPSMYGNWMLAPVSPQAMNTMMAPMNPNLYTSWMGAGMDPRTYGGMGALMPFPVPTAGGAAGLFDPAVLMKMVPIPNPPAGK